MVELVKKPREAFYSDFASKPDYVAERRQVLRVRAGLKAGDFRKVPV